jgi:hypothetical protein
MGNKSHKRRYHFAHTVGNKLRCPECGDVVWEEWDWEIKNLNYHCLGCSWANIPLVEDDNSLLIDREQSHCEVFIN